MKSTRCDKNSLFDILGERSTEIANNWRTSDTLIALALEGDIKTNDTVDFQFSEAINSTVSRTFCYNNIGKSVFTQHSLS